jgi:hypothetical protein
LGTFLGFLIISGALVTGVLIRAVLRISVRVAAMCELLNDIRRKLDSLSAERGTRVPSGSPSAECSSERAEIAS